MITLKFCDDVILKVDASQIIVLRTKNYYRLLIKDLGEYIISSEEISNGEITYILNSTVKPMPSSDCVFTKIFGR